MGMNQIHMTMILISKINKYCIFLVLLMGLFPLSSFAQESLSLSVSPTLFEMTANPGQKWESVVRVINSNPYDIRVYADRVNFRPQGESGQSTFIPVMEGETAGQTLAEWISVSEGDLIIPAEQTLEIPFTITVPDDAPPGGHFAAVLIGTKSLSDAQQTSQLETSQVVTSLVFLRVTGDVNEMGSIREFRSTKGLSESPTMDFELRFENKGNVHILPQGEIKIFNMWGQERGVIPVNRQTLFGNVLPEQIRKYTFSWTGDWSIADMGRYTAVATLAHGLDERKFDTSQTSFWVIPWKIAGMVLIGLISFIALVTWAMKLYIRKMLAMAGVDAGRQISSAQYPDRIVHKEVSVVAPIGAGILDLRNRFNTSDTWSKKFTTTFSFVATYKIFFGMLVLGVIFLSIVVWYIQTASVAQRGYEIVIDNNGGGVTLSSEQVEYDLLLENNPQQDAVIEEKDAPPLKLVNQSGINGLAAVLRIALENSGYNVSALTNEFGVSEENTVIVYHPDFQEEALRLSVIIEGSLLSAYEDAPIDEPITIYVGQSYQNDVQ
jgi:hypothetical protein